VAAREESADEPRDAASPEVSDDEAVARDADERERAARAAIGHPVRDDEVLTLAELDEILAAAAPTSPTSAEPASDELVVDEPRSATSRSATRPE
jgi:hypothetical protein